MYYFTDPNSLGFIVTQFQYLLYGLILNIYLYSSAQMTLIIFIYQILNTLQTYSSVFAWNYYGLCLVRATDQTRVLTFLYLSINWIDFNLIIILVRVWQFAVWLRIDVQSFSCYKINHISMLLGQLFNYARSPNVKIGSRNFNLNPK